MARLGGPPRLEETEALTPHRAQPPLAVLIRCVQGKSSPAWLRLATGSCRVGAGPNNHLVLEDKAVSREHLELELCPEGVRVRDLGSRNGTFYLGQRVGEITLGLGSRLTLGCTELNIAPDVEDFESTSTDGPQRYGGLLTRAASMRRLFGLLGRLEGSLVNVFIQGETGTGKELIARALHEHSRVRAGPFVALNCGVLDRALVRSELFGHKKGAFTGAVAASSGAFETADAGTLFLDEVGELPLDVQPMLLRALESRSIARVGESQEFAVNVRVIAASHCDLKDQVDDGSFRLDLYHRLMVVKLTVPSLRERPEDIRLLAAHFATGSGLPGLPEDVLSALQARSYPGNVRELRNAVLAYQAVGSLPDAGPGRPGQLERALAEVLDAGRPYAEQKEEVVQHMTRIYLSLLMQRTGGNRSEAARIAGLQRGYLRRLLERYGISQS
jgi:two-component system response regulator GlrR